tara:strand:+ start:110 stop:766 length:657 start_codon:yes stop_codon:yes gene_type:complete
MIEQNIKKINSKYENLIIYPREFSEVNQKLISAAFFDRDGVIIEDCHYIKSPEDVKLCPGAKKLLRDFYDNKICVIIITNQSGITKKILTWEDYEAVNNRMIKLLGEPNPINAIYGNSYISDKPSYNWRKPNPSMIFQAANDLKLNLNNSILIGDRLTDMIAGQRAKIPKIYHVLTGHGERERAEILKLKNKKETHNLGELLLIENLKEINYLNISNF